MALFTLVLYLAAMVPLIPVQEVKATGNVTKIAVGYNHSCAIKEDGTLWTWGWNSQGQLGDGTTANKKTPVQVPDMTNVIAVAAGYYHSVALKSDGTVWAWGGNVYGQLGNGTSLNSLRPVQVADLENIVAIARGGNHTVALKSDGTVWAWGSNDYGQLGDGTTNNSLRPVQVEDLNNVTAIAAGAYHTVAIKSDGTVWSWGGNSYGQLGNGLIKGSLIPVAAVNLTGVSAITAGDNHTMALKSDGTVWSWGANAAGQLGDKTYDKKNKPQKVNGLTGVSTINAGFTNSFAVKNDGTVYGWGDNSQGQIGNGGTANCTVPTNIPALTGVTEIAGGQNHTVALVNDANLWSWGANNYGQLGDGTLTANKTPDPINSFTVGEGGVITPPTGGDDDTNLPPVIPNDTVTNPIDEETVQEIIDTATEEKEVYVVETPVSGTTIITQLPANAFIGVAEKNSSAVLRIETPIGFMDVPVAVIDTEAIAQLVAADAAQVKVEVIIKRVTGTTADTLKKLAKTNNGVDLTGPVEFKVKLTADNGRSVEITDFNQYVARGITLTKAVSEPAGLYFNQVSGQYCPVPSTLEPGSARNMVLIKDTRCGIYAAINCKRSFQDLTRHWARKDVEKLTAKLIITGRNSNTFDPKGKVTRAEFAVMLTRALGLRGSTVAAGLKDVSNQWYAAAVNSAYQSGLIKGYTDESFRPNATISRQEMAVMVANAVKYAGTYNPSIDTERYLNQFLDKGSISDWSQEAVAFAVSAGVIRGDEKGNFRPASNATRAEAAVMLGNCMKHLGFI